MQVLRGHREAWQDAAWPAGAGEVGLFGQDVVPYWQLDPEENPVVATGFGALSDDLAERVTRVYGGVR
ncbi:hypothetical protein [Kribbella catacumbae]|uniref:hypothetical protein n=1 Tax=Kribbella catacumbae TaxID=460086 RepID=UPI0003653AB5|nr:hypothetical protein [Kribbella catacumbae]